MSRSKKDGRKGGGHRNTQGKEYWSPRGKAMMTPGRSAKDITHTMERAERRNIIRVAMAHARELMADWRAGGVKSLWPWRSWEDTQ